MPTNEGGSPGTRTDQACEAPVDWTDRVGSVLPKSVAAVALTKAEAASALGVSVRSLDKYVMPEVKVIRRGSIVPIPVRERERWAEAATESTI